MRQWHTGDTVFIHYAEKKLSLVTVPQDTVGTVLVAARLNGPKKAPKNIAVEFRQGERIVVVPYGNVRKYSQVKTIDASKINFSSPIDGRELIYKREDLCVTREDK